MGNLAEGLLEEINRNINLVVIYSSVGAAGVFALSMIRQDINLALKAIIEGDVIAMMQAFEKLKNNTD